jgi:transcription elongation factor Elf1
MSKLNTQNVKFMLRSIGKLGQKKVCPFCANTSGFETVDTKMVLVKLLSCPVCHLYFRFPQDPEEFYDDFYQEDYKIDVHLITDLPSDDRLAKMVENNFDNARSYSKYVDALFRDSGKPVRIVDYGCSWGYNVFKLKQAGFDAEGFELSKPRAAFGKKIGVDIVTDVQGLRGGNDVFLNTHVIEHLPDIKKLISLGKSKLTPEGIFLTFCPNGSPEFRARKPDHFHGIWGLVHPNYLNIEFAEYVFRDSPYMVMTGDWTGTCEAEYDLDELRQWDGQSQRVGSKRDGDELMIAARPHMPIRR